MNQKRVLFLMLLSLFLSACGKVPGQTAVSTEALQNSSEISAAAETTRDDSAASASAEDIPVMTRSVDKMPITLTQAVESYAYIMTATLKEQVGIEPGGTRLLRFQIEHIWQGDDWTEDTFLLSTYDDIFEEGIRYIILLTRRDSVFKGYEYFTAGQVLFTENGEVFYDSVIDIKAQSFEDLAAAIEKVTGETSFQGNASQTIRGAYIHSDDLQVIKEESPCIFKVLVQEIVNEPEDRTVVQCSVLETLKGSSAAQIMAAVGKDSVQVGEEYYLLLDNPDPEGIVFIISSPHSVIPADSPEAEILR